MDRERGIEVLKMCLTEVKRRKYPLPSPLPLFSPSLCPRRSGRKMTLRHWLTSFSLYSRPHPPNFGRCAPQTGLVVDLGDMTVRLVDKNGVQDIKLGDF